METNRSNHPRREVSAQHQNRCQRKGTTALIAVSPANSFIVCVARISAVMRDTGVASLSLRNCWSTFQNRNVPGMRWNSKGSIGEAIIAMLSAGANSHT